VEEDDEEEIEDESDGEDDDVDGLRLPNGFIILNDDESDDDESDDDHVYGNDDEDDREEGMEEEIKCYFAGKNEYECHVQGSKARVTKIIPENANVPNDAKGKRCCATCYNYWRRIAPV